MFNPTQASTAGQGSRPLPVRLRPRPTRPKSTMPIGLHWLLADFPPQLCLLTGVETLTVTWSFAHTSPEPAGTVGTLPSLAALYAGLPSECRLRSQLLVGDWLRVRIEW